MYGKIYKKINIIFYRGSVTIVYMHIYLVILRKQMKILLLVVIIIKVNINEGLPFTQLNMELIFMISVTIIVKSNWRGYRC